MFWRKKQSSHPILAPFERPVAILRFALLLRSQRTASSYPEAAVKQM